MEGIEYIDYLRTCEDVKKRRSPLKLLELEAIGIYEEFRPPVREEKPPFYEILRNIKRDMLKQKDSEKYGKSAPTRLNLENTDFSYFSSPRILGLI